MVIHQRLYYIKRKETLTKLIITPVKLSLIGVQLEFCTMGI